MSELTNPFPGIRPFREDDAKNFYGRENQTEELLRRLEQVRFVSVVGDSGCGKSSLIHAGLLPLLQKENWNIVITRPQNSPLENLAIELKKIEYLGFDDDFTGELKSIWERMIPNTLNLTSQGIIDTFNQTNSPHKLLIIVDQFEELFSYKTRGALERENSLKFVRLLIEAASQKEFPIHIIIVMRADHLGYCSQFKGLPELINLGQFLIPRLTREQYRDVISKPFEKQGVRVASNVISTLLNDIEDDPDQLPVLQHVLRHTYEEWQNDENKEESLVDARHYNLAGGMTGSINKACDSILIELNKLGLGDATKIFFQRLTDVNLEGRGIRCPTQLDQLMAIANISFDQACKIIDLFREDGKNFLSPSSTVPLTESRVIDLGHECIMRTWIQLSDWIKDEQEDRRNLLKLVEHNSNYLAGERGLLKDLTLSYYLNWSKFISSDKETTKFWASRYTSDFTSAAQFIQESRNYVLRNQRTKRRNRRLLVFGTPIMALLAIVVISFRYLTARESLREKEDGVNSLQLKLNHQGDSLQDVLNLISNAPDGDKHAELFRRNRELDRENREMKKIIENLSSDEVQLKSQLDSLETISAQQINNREKLISTFKNYEIKAKTKQDSALILAGIQYQSDIQNLEIELENRKKEYTDSVKLMKKTMSLERGLKDYFAIQFAEELKRNHALLDEFERRIRTDNSVSPELASSINDYIKDQKKKLATILGKISNQHKILLYTKHEHSEERLNEFKQLLRNEGYDGNIVDKPMNRSFFDNNGITILAGEQKTLDLMKAFISMTRFKNLRLNDALKNPEMVIAKPDINTTIVILDY